MRRPEYGRKSKRRCDIGETMLWLTASYLEAQSYKPRRGDDLCPIFKSLERVGTVQNTIPEGLRK